MTEDRDVLYMLVGYSIVYGLKNVTIHTSSEKEMTFQEMKQIYKSMDKAISASKESDAYSHLEKMRAELTAGDYKSSSPLLKLILESENGLNDSMLRAFGNKLMEEVQYSGIDRKNKEIMEIDYQKIVKRV